MNEPIMHHRCGIQSSLNGDTECVLCREPLLFFTSACCPYKPNEALGDTLVVLVGTRGAVCVSGQGAIELQEAIDSQVAQ